MNNNFLKNIFKWFRTLAPRRLNKEVTNKKGFSSQPYWRYCWQMAGYINPSLFTEYHPTLSAVTLAANFKTIAELTAVLSDANEKVRSQQIVTLPPLYAVYTVSVDTFISVAKNGMYQNAEASVADFKETLLSLTEALTHTEAEDIGVAAYNRNVLVKVLKTSYQVSHALARV